MERIIALDIGTVRIGVAVSDPSGALAQGVSVLDASKGWMDELSAILREYEAKTLLVGMPRRTDGTDGPEAVKMRETIAKMSRALPEIKIVEWDERYTTTIATQALIEADVSRARRKKSVDKVAAVLLLQSYLDSKNETSAVPPAPGVEFSAPSSGKPKGKRKRDSAYD